MHPLLIKLEREYFDQYDFKLRHNLEEYTIPEIATAFVDWFADVEKNSESLNFVDLTIIARDFYIGSDLTQQEKQDYVKELIRQGFFEHLNKWLYSEEFTFSRWTIYIFGTFSQPQLVTYLEAAYENAYLNQNPILSYRCLTELNWLGSTKAPIYLENLRQQHDIISRWTLLQYEDELSELNEIERLLTDQEIIDTIVSKTELKNSTDVLIYYLKEFEKSVLTFQNDAKTDTISEQQFIELAKKTFRELIIKLNLLESDD